MAPPYAQWVLRQASCYPVTSALLAATLLIYVLSYILNGCGRLVLDSRIIYLDPWCLFTYVLVAPPPGGLLTTSANLALFATLGAEAEGSIGSAGYAVSLAFSAIVTALLTILLDHVFLSPLASLYGGLEIGRSGPIETGIPVWTNIYYGHYVYWGVWPAAHAIVFALCRSRGVAAPVGPALRGRRLALQHIPLALVAAAAVSDVYGIVLGWRTLTSELVVGWACPVAAISMFVAWLQERHATASAATAPGSGAFPLDTFFYPAALRAAVRGAGESTYALLRPTRLSFLLPPRATVGAGAAAGPIAVAVAGEATTATAAGGGGSALLPGTTAEEAERYRLIAREALARRLQEQRQRGTEGAEEATARVPASRPSPTPVGETTDEADDKTA